MYYCNSTATAQTITNKPYNDAFSLLVEKHAGYKQTFTVYYYTGPYTWIRNYYNGTWGKWQRQYVATELYNNTSGTDGTVTLSETSANFSYIDIFFLDTQGTNKYDFVRVYSPNGKNVNLNSVIKDPGQDVIFLFSSIVAISGTQIVFNYKGQSHIYEHSSNTYSDSNSIKIVRVDGYR